MFGSIDLVDFAISILVLFFSIAIHEFAHAWSALQLGDRTAYYQGRVTLNPAAHLEPIGTMMIFISALTGYGIGWGKPVPVNPRNLRYGPRVGMALTAAAGPISNILQAIAWGIPLRLYVHQTIGLPALAVQVIRLGFIINIHLALFNLIPLFPLDGSRVVQGILATIRARWAYDLSDFLDQLQPHAPMILLFLIFIGHAFPAFDILGLVLHTPANALANLILGV